MQIQRNYEILLEQNKALSDLYIAEKTSKEKIQDRLKKHAAQRGADYEGLESGLLKMDDNDWVSSTNDGRIGINRNNSCTSNNNIGANHRLLCELEALESTREMLAQFQIRLSTQQDYIVGLESLVASSNKKIERLTLLCESLLTKKN